MAKNPTWCQPLSRWKQYHRKWIESDDPERLPCTSPTPPR
ncbi:MAG: DUF294 nucleotidyltransferase-like domain-containing protein [Polyangia bacterium]